ncbi:MAG TPA: alanine racemase [Mycobacteriales bacterium]|nr:alanine racemase [Mycobacteriales bacterium]
MTPTPGGLRRARCEVDLDAIAASVTTLREHAGDAAVMAVVKADAYGHGMVASARAALAGGAGWLGTATLDEALAVRAAGITAPLLTWLAIPGEDLADGIRADVDLAAYAPWMVDELVSAARATGRTARVHLKVDTGLSRGGARLGQDWQDLVDAAAKAQAEQAIEVVGVWSHLVHADSPRHPTTDAQIAGFTEALGIAERVGLRPQVRHLANSAATLTRPDAHFDVVRPGIAVYGLSPIPDLASAEQLGLRPAMTLAGAVALTKRVPPGTGVSYGHVHTTTHETTLALVPFGYADGVPRAATGRAQVWLGGARRRIDARVCMDQLVVEVGDDPVQPGDEVVLFGPGEHGEPTVQDWADWLGTISYEVVTGVGHRLPRVHVGTAGSMDA